MKSDTGKIGQMLQAAGPALLAGVLFLFLSLFPDGLPGTFLFGGGIFLVSLGLGVALTVLFIHSQRPGCLDRVPTRIWLWIGRWHLLVLGIVLAGAMLGGAAFPLFGSLLGMQLSLGEMTLNGFKDGGLLAFIWAPGISLVACIILANRKSGRHRVNHPNTLDTKNKYS